MFTRAFALAATIAAVASAGFNPALSSNVAVYWGEGEAQIPLSEVCSDDSVDIVNLAFVNKSPQSIGDYPGSNPTLALRRVPSNYSLPTPELAEYFAEFLWGAFGPVTQEWERAGLPRPFGDYALDGFDLNLEASLRRSPCCPDAY
ncbi:hypothetical protein CC80DRAFT_591501 [Byssothecium circinans]|uniref:Uncharacterized protein n=1 Tax=Byssothecium circinans TaxID=147558 RepID=A0A6A5U6E6_9PLEO|nr:hypothetical protein CC80DRAFT_591501 [Byssothecium circinans]